MESVLINENVKKASNINSFRRVIKKNKLKK